MPENQLFLTLAAGALAASGALLLWPQRGLYWRWRRGQELTERITLEDALKHIHQCEIHGETCSLKSLAGALAISADSAARILDRLEAHELLRVEGGAFRLAPAGREYALRIIRAHRLYERYLADETGFQETDWHDRADRYEHTLTVDEANALAARLGYPTHDPHGDPIPTADGHMVYPQRTPLTALEPDRPARILHLEDEPEAVYAQLVAEGLHVGQVVRLLETSPQRVRLWAGGDEHVLAPVVAANIAVAPLAEASTGERSDGERLSGLQRGGRARVTRLSRRIRGAERRRLMDLGLLPGTEITHEMSSIAGDPIAYRVRDAIIALRRSQAEQIYVQPLEGETGDDRSDLQEAKKELA